MHNKSSADWWWAELQGEIGYVPASYLRLDGAEEGDDPWQDDEYFGSYGTLVRNIELSSFCFNFLQVSQTD